MNENVLRRVTEQLRDEEGKLNGEMVGLQKQLAGLEKERARIQSALAALNGGAKRKRSRCSAKAVTTAEVVRMIEEELSRRGSATEAELKQAVEQRLGREGRSRSGLHLRFKAAMNDIRFQLQAGRWTHIVTKGPKCAGKDSSLL